MNHKEEDKEIRYTPWVTFVWAIGVITILIFMILGMAITASSTAASTRQEVQSHEDSSKAEMEWVKASLVRIESKLDKVR